MLSSGVASVRRGDRDLGGVEPAASTRIDGVEVGVVGVVLADGDTMSRSGDEEFGASLDESGVGEEAVEFDGVAVPSFRLVLPKLNISSIEASTFSSSLGLFSCLDGVVVSDESLKFLFVFNFCLSH